VMCGGSSSDRRTRAHPAWRWRLRLPSQRWRGGRGGGRRNRKGATAVVTRRGCRREDSSRGVNCVAGKAARSPVIKTGSRIFRPKRGEPHDRQRDATSPRLPGTVIRRGGAKPRGRQCPGPGRPADPSGGNVARGGRHGGGSSEPTRRSPTRSRKCVDGGVNPDESHERRPDRARSRARLFDEAAFAVAKAWARAGRRLRSGGEGHGGADDRVTDRRERSPGNLEDPTDRVGGARRKPGAAPPGR